MKIRIFLLYVLLIVSMGLQKVSADTITTPLKEINDGNDENEVPKKGGRMPARPVQCTIDTDTKMVTLTPSVEDIESYEIWDESYNTLLFSTDNASEFVDGLMSYNAPILIAITTSDHTYVGCL